MNSCGSNASGLGLERGSKNPGGDGVLNRSDILTHVCRLMINQSLNYDRYLLQARFR